MKTVFALAAAAVMTPVLLAAPAQARTQTLPQPTQTQTFASVLEPGSERDRNCRVLPAGGPKAAPRVQLVCR